jgi:hypothetical protein
MRERFTWKSIAALGVAMLVAVLASAVYRAFVFSEF